MLSRDGGGLVVTVDSECRRALDGTSLTRLPRPLPILYAWKLPPSWEEGWLGGPLPSSS